MNYSFKSCSLDEQTFNQEHIHISLIYEKFKILGLIFKFTNKLPHFLSD